MKDLNNFVLYLGSCCIIWLLSAFVQTSFMMWASLGMLVGLLIWVIYLRMEG